MIQFSENRSDFMIKTLIRNSLILLNPLGEENTN